MGKLRILTSSPLATVQDEGRFGYRKYGIPQSGAIDTLGMTIANQLVGNAANNPAIEFALGGITLEVIEPTQLGVFGAGIHLNGQPIRENVVEAGQGDLVALTAPRLVYAYLALGGQLTADYIFDSFSTYLPAKFGGYQGRSLRKGDLLQSIGNGALHDVPSIGEPDHLIRFRKGPEWSQMDQPLHQKKYAIDPTSNRIGIRLFGEHLTSKIPEITSSAVIPGTIQLPPNGQPIVLMNDCQTTGGYPRIGQVVEEDLRKLGQTRIGSEITLILE